MRAKLVIVSNRLPVSIARSGSDFTVTPSVGGLATGLASYAGKRGTLWIGWPGLPSDDLSDADQRKITTKLKKLGCHPVFLTKKQITDFYNGYSNSVLWPVFHEQTPTAEQPRSWWQSYRSVNELFAAEALRFVERASQIWVHDYQLLLMPGMLRDQRPDLHIGFFLHIPFPPPETFRVVKEHKQLMRGVLGADIVGLHTPSYCQNFLETADETRIGTRSSEHSIALPGHICRVSDFPMGIDYAKFKRATKTRGVQHYVRSFAYRYRGKKVILTVDRLDPTKGLYERLQAYHKLLAQHAGFHRKVVFVMLAVPSRTEIPAYQKLKVRVEKLVMNINETYGTRSWKPVEYLYQSMPFEQLSALYRRADVAFIAPLKDGMNLVAKEYIASKHGRDGVLILSSTAGAAEELTDAIMVDPQRPASLVRGLRSALTMPKPELRRRLRNMQQHLETATVQAWATTFITQLRRPLALPGRSAAKTLTPSRQEKVIEQFASAKKPLLLLDYDGTLTPIVKRPEDAKPSNDLRQLLKRLSKRTSVVIISGRSRDDLQTWLGDLPLTLIAEHGAARREFGSNTWTETAGLAKDWHEPVKHLLEKATTGTPGSHIEQKPWSLVWHYRGANQARAKASSILLQRRLQKIQKDYDFVIKDGKKIIEISSGAVHKGHAAAELAVQHDFTLAAGDDQTDEDMLTALPGASITIKIGPGKTAARYRLKSPTELLAFLAKLT